MLYTIRFSGIIIFKKIADAQIESVFLSLKKINRGGLNIEYLLESGGS